MKRFYSIESSRKDFIRIPTSIKPFVNYTPRHFQFFGPLGNIHCLTVKSYKANLSRIIGLFFSGRPLAVFWKVSFIVVSAFNGHALRFFSHISKKVLKLLPSFAHFDATSAIEFINFRCCRSASVKHARPNIVDLGVFTCMSMNSISTCGRASLSRVFSAWMHKKLFLTKSAFLGNHCFLKLNSPPEKAGRLYNNQCLPAFSGSLFSYT